MPRWWKHYLLCFHLAWTCRIISTTQPASQLHMNLSDYDMRMIKQHLVQSWICFFENMRNKSLCFQTVHLNFHNFLKHCWWPFYSLHFYKLLKLSQILLLQSLLLLWVFGVNQHLIILSICFIFCHGNTLFICIIFLLSITHDCFCRSLFSRCALSTYEAIWFLDTAYFACFWIICVAQQSANNWVAFFPLLL